MHKSGTTMIAETLNRAGIAMVDDVTEGSYDQGNTVERISTRALNKTAVALGRPHSLSIAAPLRTAQPQHRSVAVQLLSSLAASASSPALTSNQSPAWGFKDPRTLLTYRALWEPLLSDPCLVGIVRHPAAVFAHYRRCHALYRPRALWRLLWQCLSVWLAHNRELQAIQRRHPQLLLLEYGTFLAGDAGLEALACHVGRPLPDCRRPELQRCQPRRTALYQLARVIAWLRQGQDPDRLYRALQQLVVS
jgi:hypothetical protein